MPATNNYKKWTKQEDEQLVKRLAYDEKIISYEEMAGILNRTVDAVQSRFVKIYVVPKYSEGFLKKNTKYISKLYVMREVDLIRYLKYAGVRTYNDSSDSSDSNYSTESDDTDTSENQMSETDTSASTESTESSEYQDEYSETDEESLKDNDTIRSSPKSSFEFRISMKLNILHIAMIAGGCVMLYYFYPTIMRSV